MRFVDRPPHAAAVSMRFPDDLVARLVASGLWQVEDDLDGALPA